MEVADTTGLVINEKNGKQTGGTIMKHLEQYFSWLIIGRLLGACVPRGIEGIIMHRAWHCFGTHD